MEHDRITLNIPAVLRGKIDSRIRKTGYNMSELIRRWIERGIDEDEAKEKPPPTKDKQ